MMSRAPAAGHSSRVMVFVEDDVFVIGAGGVHCAGAVGRSTTNDDHVAFD